MELRKSIDILNLLGGEVISKRNLFDLIQFSKVENSPFWSGADFSIGNTPQQGINWIGCMPNILGVIIKSRSGAYDADGWSDKKKNFYHYSFKARNGAVNYREKANEVLIRQPQYQYPILLFSEIKKGWSFEGRFGLSSIENEYVVLEKSFANVNFSPPSQDELLFQEGGKKYVTHLLAERSKGIVSALKSAQSWICDICEINFEDNYGVKYIEAHHKVPISTFSNNCTVSLSDLALLCPNCHKAVHIFMKIDGLEYLEIKKKLKIRDASIWSLASSPKPATKLKQLTQND